MQYFGYLALFATTVIALPLNINLGAYSPALVVGDGEISFGGAEAEAAAAPAAAAGGQAAGGQAGGQAAGGQAAGGAAGGEAGGAAKGGETGGAAKGGETGGAAKGGETGGAAKGGATGEGKTINDSTTAAQLAALGGVTSSETAVPASGTGMGKNVQPQVVNPVFGNTKTKRSVDSELVKRQNFAAALQYATTALKTGPEIQLGTGEGGSGVGITQKAGGGVARRDVDERSDRGPTVTLLKIRTLADTSSKTRRDGESMKRGVEVDEEGNVNVNMEGEIEMVIAEVKA